MSNKSKFICKTCGKELDTDNPRTKYCSDECKYTKECEICGQKFKGSSNSVRFCSDECRNKRCLNTCIVCNEQFRSSSIKSKFCSNECKDKFTYKCICFKCGKDFHSKTPNTKYCSYDCYNNAYSNICSVCGNIFNGRYPNTKYCSEMCRKNMYVIKCKVCDKKFRSQSSGAQYCSSECMKIPTTEVICECCNKTFKRSSTSILRTCSDECRKISEKNRYKKEKKTKTLTKSNYKYMVIFTVKEIIQKGIEARDSFGISRNYHVDGFTSVKRVETEKRDNYTCRVCGKKNSLEVHHIIKVIHGGNSDLDNLITLCRSCHRAIDTLDLDYALKKCMRNAEKYLGLIYVKDEFTTKERMELSILELNAIYSKLSRLGLKLNDEIEIQESLIQLNEIIEKMQDSIE